MWDRLIPDRTLVLLVLGALIALGIAAGFTLATPNATFIGYETDGSYGARFDALCTSSAWDYMVGSYYTPKPTSLDITEDDVDNLEYANAACLHAVHQRQTWSILLVIVAAGLAVGAGIRARTIIVGSRREAAESP
jgi:hypothetical protein